MNFVRYEKHLVTTTIKIENACKVWKYFHFIFALLLYMKFCIAIKFVSILMCIDVILIRRVSHVDNFGFNFFFAQVFCSWFIFRATNILQRQFSYQKIKRSYRNFFWKLNISSSSRGKSWYNKFKFLVAAKGTRLLKLH